MTHVQLRRRSLLGTVLLVVAAGCGGDRESTPQRPDVLLLVIDTLRADRLGCYGYPRPTSPVIDGIAARGAVFTRASAQCPWTVPSMSSLVTGRYPTAHQERPSLGAVTLAEHFRASGYATLGVVANSLLDPGAGFERGFDVYVPREDENGNRKNPGDFRTMLDWVDRPLREALAPGPEGERKPLFLYMHPSDPHAPYEGRQEYLSHLPVDTVPPVLPEGWQRERLAELGPEPPDDDPEWSEALFAIQRQRNAYDHDVRATDEALGVLLGRLKALGVGDDLVVAIVSDHGEGLWEHVLNVPEEKLKDMPPRMFFFQSHGYDLTEQALRTPFVLAGPGVPAGVEIDAPVDNVDLYPTLLSLCGLERPGELHGLDLVPLLRGKVDPDEWRDETYAFVIHSVCIRDEERNLKLVLPTPFGAERGLDRPRLYDLDADPLERHDLFAERPAEARDLTDRLLAYLERYEGQDERLTGAEAEEMRRRMGELGYGGSLVGEDEDGEEDDEGKPK